MLRTKIVALDVIAKVVVLDDASLKELLDTMLQIEAIHMYKMLGIRQKARCKWVLEDDENSSFFPWNRKYEQKEITHKWFKH